MGYMEPLDAITILSQKTLIYLMRLQHLTIRVTLKTYFNHT